MGHAKTVRLRLRWPPFDAESVNAKALPIAIAEYRLSNAKSAPCELQMGGEDSFFVERILSDSIGSADSPRWIEPSKSAPPQLCSNRSGWFLTPNRGHRLARRMIGVAVVSIILALIIHAFEPVLVNAGIMSESYAGSIRIGLLDYPVLLLIFLPVFFIPILMRIGSNIVDYRRTRKFLAAPPPSLSIRVVGEPNTTDSVSVKIQFPKPIENWISAKAGVQVGMTTPSREVLLRAVGCDEGDQNPPGFSTSLPRIFLQEDMMGTGIGERTPLEGPDKERLFLAPLPVQGSGELVEISVEDACDAGTTVNLPLPVGQWPGSEYSSLLSFHWEVVVIVEIEGDLPLKWVKPIQVSHDGSARSMAELPVQLSRAEMVT